MAESEPIPTITATQGDPNFARVSEIMSAMLAAAAFDQQSDDIDPRHHTALTMAAAGFLAGYLGGASIIAGAADDRDKRRMGEMLLTNFRQGIKIGKANALMSAANRPGAGHA